MSLCRILIVRYSRRLAEHLLHLLAEDLARPVVGIDDAVADLELDVRERLGALKIPPGALPLAL